MSAERGLKVLFKVRRTATQAYSHDSGLVGSLPWVVSNPLEGGGGLVCYSLRLFAVEIMGAVVSNDVIIC